MEYLSDLSLARIVAQQTNFKCECHCTERVQWFWQRTVWYRWNFGEYSIKTRWVGDSWFNHSIIQLFQSNTFTFAGNFNLFAIICAIGFITIAIVVPIIVLSMNRHSAKYYTNEDKRCGKSNIHRLQRGIRSPIQTTYIQTYTFILILQMDYTRKISIRSQSQEMRWATNFPSKTSFIQLTRQHCNLQHNHH